MIGRGSEKSRQPWLAPCHNRLSTSGSCIDSPVPQTFELRISPYERGGGEVHESDDPVTQLVTAETMVPGVGVEPTCPVRDSRF
jgi:hypothetical protein